MDWFDYFLEHQNANFLARSSHRPLMQIPEPFQAPKRFSKRMVPLFIEKPFPLKKKDYTIENVVKILILNVYKLRNYNEMPKTVPEVNILSLYETLFQNLYEQLKIVNMVLKEKRRTPIEMSQLFTCLASQVIQDEALIQLLCHWSVIDEIKVCIAEFEAFLYKHMDGSTAFELCNFIEKIHHVTPVIFEIQQLMKLQ
jgi:hypothetical protein